MITPTEAVPSVTFGHPLTGHRYHRVIALVRDIAAAHTLAHWPGSPFNAVPEVAAAGALGYYVLGSNSTFDTGVAAAALGQFPSLATALVGSNLLAQDRANAFTVVQVNTSDPMAVIRASRGLAPETTNHTAAILASERRALNATGPIPTTRIKELIRRAALKAGIDPVLALAVAARESGFDAKAANPSGAVGLMGLKPSVQHDYKVEDPFDPADNARGGCELLAHILGPHKIAPDASTLVVALTRYHSGTGNFMKRGLIPADLSYVNDVLVSMAALQGSV